MKKKVLTILVLDLKNQIMNTLSKGTPSPGEVCSVDVPFVG